MTTSGTVIATIAAGRATDLAGNNNTASTSTDNTVTWDVDRAHGDHQPGGRPGRPDQHRPINFTVTFSEAVTGFATGDVTLRGHRGRGQDRHRVTGGPTIYTSRSPA